METKQKERIRRLMELLKKTDRIHLKTPRGCWRFP